VEETIGNFAIWGALGLLFLVVIIMVFQVFTFFKPKD
jgi:hypothetical protein